MNTHLHLVASLFLGLTLATASAQPQMPTGPDMSGGMEKLFGDNGDFSATVEFQATVPHSGQTTMTGKMVHTAGKTRFEMDMTTAQNASMPPQALAQMRKMGMSKMVSLNNAGGTSYMIYPDMQAYLELPKLTASPTPASDYKVDMTKLGEENIDGHPCIKNKCVVTGPSGQSHESTVWNATDLKQFPLKIEGKSKNGEPLVMFFKDVKLEKPDDSQFDPPAGYQKYDDMRSLMMSRARAGAGR